MMQTETQPPGSPLPPRQLKTSDRCDRCGAEAFARADVNLTYLYFCGHHFAQYEDALWDVATAILDERVYINAKPSVSASHFGEEDDDCWC